MTQPWVLISGDFASDGGQDRANLALALRLATRKTPVHVVAHRVDPDLAANPRVTVHLAPRPLGSHTLGSVLLDRLGRQVARANSGARVVVNGANCLWPDVCWIHCVHAAYRLPAPHPGERRRWARARATQWRNRQRERRALADARLVIANSERTVRDLRALGVSDARLALVPLGVDPERFGPTSPGVQRAARSALGFPPDRPLVVFVGALGALDMKGIDTLVRAWARLCNDPAWQADLRIVGGGRVTAWTERVRALGLAERITLAGRVSDTSTLLAAADVLVHPTRYDSYGLAVHEALCRGRPVVVSRAAGVSERIDTQSALAELVLNDPGDDRQLAMLLRQALSDLPRFTAAAEILGAELRRWTWGAMADRLIEAVEESSAQPR